MQRMEVQLNCILPGELLLPLSVATHETRGTVAVKMDPTKPHSRVQYTDGEALVQTQCTQVHPTVALCDAQ
jgi:hypothetical protein